MKKLALLIWISYALWSTATFALPAPLALNDAVESVTVRPENIEVFTDTNNLLDLDEVILLENGRYETEHPGFGSLPESTYWLRFKIDARVSDQHKWVLEILDSRHREITLYEPQENGGYIAHETGIAQGFETRKYGHKNFVMDIDLKHAKEGYYYLRFRSGVVGSFVFKIRSNHEFSAYAFDEYYLLGLYYGILFIIAVYNFFIFLTLRERIYLVYVLYVLSWAFFSMLDDGTGFQYYWTNQTWVSTLGFLIVRPILVCCFVLYSRHFLETNKRFPLADQLIIASAIIYTLFHFLNSLVQWSWVENILYVLPFAIIYVVGFKVFKSGFRPALYFLIGNTFVLLGIVIRILTDNSFMEQLTHNQTVLVLSVYSANIGKVLDIVILSLALAARIRFLKNKEEEAQKEVISHLKEKEELSEKVNKELEQKVTERTVEIEEQRLALEEANRKLQDQAEEINRMNLMLDLDNRKLQKDVQKVNEARIQFREVTFDEFKKIYPNDLAVQRYLAKIKWAEPYTCKRCGNEKHCDGSKKFSRRCTKCRYDESVTAYTLFHKCKFPLVNALFIVMKVNRHGDQISSYELARQLEMRKSTVWSFKQKVVASMEKQKGTRKGSEEDNLARLIVAPKVGK